MEVIFMRGIPGSGKSTWAREFVNKINQEIPLRSCAIVISADDFLTDLSTGVYSWSRERMLIAHQRCLHAFIHHCIAPFEGYLIVDNANCRERDIAPYIRVAEAYSHPMRIARMHCLVSVAMGRQTHQVPLRTVDNMAFELGKSLCAEWAKLEQIIDTN